MANYLKINKKTGVGGPLALEGVCKFFPIFKFRFWFTFIYRSSNHLSSTKRPEITPI